MDDMLVDPECHSKSPLFHFPTPLKSHLYHPLLHLCRLISQCRTIDNLLGTLILIWNLCNLSTKNPLLQCQYYHTLFLLCAINYGQLQIHLISFVNIFIDHHLILIHLFHLKTSFSAMSKWIHHPHPHQHHLLFITISQLSH